MLCYARAHSIRVAAEDGSHHVRAGLAASASSSTGGLARSAIEPDCAVVDAGVTWNALTKSAYAVGRTPPVLTGYLGLSWGDPLCIGISSTNRNNTGGSSRCSSRDRRGRSAVLGAQHRALFGVLAGLGQLGIITKPSSISCGATNAHVSDQPAIRPVLLRPRTLLERGSSTSTTGFPDGAGSWVYQLTATKFPTRRLRRRYLLRGLTVDSSASKLKHAVRTTSCASTW
jgi:hypothetical protein